METEQMTELTQKIVAALETVRPHLLVDGGDVELVEVTEDMDVRIKWIGMCESCSMSAFTLKAGIEDAVKRAAPEVKSVTAINGRTLPFG
jgi:Fe-S cluster biogenesis protein NfuA